MNSFKDKVVREIIRLGKKKHSLRMPALALAALFLVTYHSVRNFFLQFRYHPVRQRILVGILILSLLAGQIGIINVFAESEGGTTETVEDTGDGEAGNAENRMISAFIELPDDVREQTVPAGTDISELELPDTLEAYVAVEAEDDADDDKKPDDGDQNKDDDENSDDSDQNKGDQEKPDDSGQNKDDKENPDGENGDGGENPDDSNKDGGEIELLMRPYDEETSSDIVYYLADSYDSCAWEIWTGEEWEEIGESEPELVVGKEEWYTYRFRCIVTKDGVRYTAQAQDDWQIDNFGLMTMAADSAATGQSSYMYYDNSGKLFNVKGIDNNTMIQTTFMDAGYRTASAVGGGSKVDWNGAGETAMGNSLYGTRDISLVYNGRYAKITYTVVNRGSASQSFQVGSSADVMIGNNDCAPVVGNKNGLVMSGSPKNSYTFNLVAPKVSTLWYGYWTKAYENMFTNLADRSTPYDKDSGMAWSWSDTVAPGRTWSRYVLVGVGDLPEPPQIPTLTNKDPQLSPGTPTVFTGTAQPGNTVCIEVGGEEFSGTADKNGNFSVTVTPPLGMPEGETDVNYYAVSEEGGISDVGTITATVVTAPSIVLTDTAVSVVEDSELSDTWYRSFISSSSGTVSYNASAVKTGTPGSYTVTYTAKKTGYADATAKLTVTVLPLPLELSGVTAARVSGKDSFTLTASLLHTGGGTISETGFVWGIMQNPTVSLNNGSKKTTSVVKTKNAKLTVTAEQIVDGVTYYARAYVKTSDGNVYYSSQKSFSINGKSYGTFTITYKGGDTKTFTVTRTGGTDGAQTVYYRTVNGSAIGGTHFTHQASTLTFAAGESSKTITITEKSVTTLYNSKAATAYSNADRTYQVEIYRVDGGGALGSTTRATRTMTKDSSYAVNRNVYTTEKERPVPTNNDNNYVSDRSGGADHKTYFRNNRGYNLTHNQDNFNVQRTVDVGNEKENTYLKNTAEGYYYRLRFTAKEVDDGYQHIWIADHKPNDFDSANEHKGAINIDDNLFGPAKYTARFEINNKSTADIALTGTRNNVSGFSPSIRTGAMEGDYLLFGINDEVNVWFSAAGSGEDKWQVLTYTDWLKVKDTKEPQLLGVAPMDTISTYKAGDKVTVSLVFDEIVDSTNSTLSSVSLNTSWGTFAYAGGADTNVLYFTGTVPSNATGTLTVNSITNADKIKDMCSTSGTKASGSGSVTVNVDNKTPTVFITGTSIANKTATATINATNADTLQYTWSQNSAMPVTGWLTSTSGQTVSTKQTSGTWYLHVLGTYNATGAAAHTYASFDFSSSTSGAMPELTLSADNSAWAQSRIITLTKTPSTATVKVKTPSGTTSTVSGTSYTAMANGTYTFTLTSGAETVVKSITVSKIDRTAPTAVITGPASLTQNENVILTVTPTDEGGSGVGTVTGTWTTTTNGGTATTVTATVTKNSDGTYSATTPGTAANNYTYKLTVTVTDNAGNTGSAVSSTYAVNLKAPTVSVNRTSYNNKGHTYSYTVNANGNTITAVQLPDGTVTTALTGTFTLTSPGTYYVTASDTAGHVVRSSAMTVAAGVDGDAPEVRLYQQNTDWADQALIDVSIYEEGSIRTAVWKKEGESSNTTVTCSMKETSVYSGAFSVTKNGTYTVTVTDANGNVGTDSITVSNIDKTAPKVTYTVNATPNANSGWYTASPLPVVITFADEAGEEGGTPSGIQSAQITHVTNNTVKPTSGFTTLNASEISSGAYTYNKINNSHNGNYYLYYKVTDKRGNETEGFSNLIQKDSYAVSSSITGPTTGQPVSTGLAMNIKLTYGPSGGYLTGGPTAAPERIATMGQHAESTKTIDAAYTAKTPGINYFRYYRYAENGETGTTSTNNWAFYVRQIDFNSQGGSAVASQLVWHDSTTTIRCKVVKPADPTRTGYTFGGWYTDAACTAGKEFDFNTQVRANTTLYAKWTANTYNVTYHLTYPNGSAYAPANTTYTYGQGLTLPKLEQTGFTFDGWYENDSYTGTKYTLISKTATGNKKYYAHFKDTQAPVIEFASYNAALSSGASDDWRRAQDGFTPKIEVSCTDNVAVKEVLVRVDNGSFSETGVSPYGANNYQYELQEGEHTYTFRARDDAGNETVSATWTVKLDKTKPEIGNITYEKKVAGFLNWIIGKESLIVHIPVTDNLSGVTGLSYAETTITGSEETTQTKTVSLSGKPGQQTVDLELDADWKGRISDITCTDKAGNVSDSKTVGGENGGVIVEDNAPVITITEADMSDPAYPKPGSAVSADYYEDGAAPTLYVSVKDETVATDVSAGIKSITYSVGGGEEQTVPEDFMTRLSGEHGFTIPMAGKVGAVNVTVKATDHAGNTAQKSVNVKIKGKEAVPNAKTAYPKDALANLTPGAAYEITVPAGEGGTPYTYNADENGEIPLILPISEEDTRDLCGETIGIVKKGDGNYITDSAPQTLAIAERPSALTGKVTPELAEGMDDAIINIKISSVTGKKEYSIDGGKTWTDVPDDDIIKDLAPGNVLVRMKATETAPSGQKGTITVNPGSAKIKVEFALNYAGAEASSAPPAKSGLTGKAPLDEPNDPTRDGFDFTGWYKSEACEENERWRFEATEDKKANVVGDIIDRTKEDYRDVYYVVDGVITVTLYAGWRENVAPNLNAALMDNSGQKEGSNWYQNLFINVTYSDNVGVTKLYAKTDDGAYTELEISDSTQYRYIYNDLQEGEHTYTFKAVDAAGNWTETRLTAKLDSIKPTLGEAAFNEGYKNLWDWIIRKDSLIITIPVTEAGSGLDAVEYTLTPADRQGGNAGNSTGGNGADGSGDITTGIATVKKTSDGNADYEATITIAPDFKGTIRIAAKDKAGNVSDTKTIGADGSGIKGVIVEDNAPVITILADRGTADDAPTQSGGTALSEDYYNSAPKLFVKVEDNEADGSGITSGLEAVLWKISDSAEHAESADFESEVKTSHSFTIGELEGRTGILQVTVKAVDQAGNTAQETVTVHVKARAEKPAPDIDYLNEKLTGLVPNGKYGVGEETVAADEQGCITIREEWFGGERQIYRKGEGITLDSENADVSIAARPDAPDVSVELHETIRGKNDAALTGVDTTMEYSVDGGSTWTTVKESDITDECMTDCAVGRILFRVEATSSAPRGETAEVTVEAGKLLKVTFEEKGGSSVSDLTGKMWHDTVAEPEKPVRAGYVFEGWYRDAAYTNLWHFASAGTGADLLTDDLTLYAKWRDNTRPAINAVLRDSNGVKDGKNWYQNLSVTLTYSDNAGVTKLYVKVDGGAYTELAAADGGSGVINGSTGNGNDATRNVRYQYIYNNLQEGEHTYTFKAEDAAGNEMESNTLTAKLDRTKPVFGEAAFSEGYKNLWDWIIRKESLIITIPVSEAGSGIEAVEYTLTPAGGSDGSMGGSGAGGSIGGNEDITTGVAEVKKASGNDADYTATITIVSNFKGTITVVAKDKVGNTSDTKTIGTDGGGIKGVIVEDNAPRISFAASGSALSENYYDEAPELTVYVADDADEHGETMITGGIASVTYQVGSGSAKAVNHDYTSNIVTRDSFTISAAEIPGGVTRITVTATDHAGNQAVQSITVKVKALEETPHAGIGYRAETLTGLVANAAYLIGDVGMTADADGTIAIEEDWISEMLSIVKLGNDSTTINSAPQNLSVPARPAAPAVSGRNETYPGAGDGVLTGLTAGTAYEISDDGGSTWNNAALNGTEIRGLAAGTYQVRVKAVESVNFKSGAAEVTVGTTPPTPYETPNAQIDYRAETLKGLVPDAAYELTYGVLEEEAGSGDSEDSSNSSDDSGDNGGNEEVEPIVLTLTAGEDGTIRIKEEWLGEKCHIVRIGNGKDKTDSAAQELDIPVRPAAPVPTGVDVDRNNPTELAKLKDLNPNTAYDVSADGGKTWETKTTDGNGVIKGLDAPESYRVRVSATDSNFASKPSNGVAVGSFELTVTFMANGEKHQEVKVYYGKKLSPVPTVPLKKDAGDQVLAGEWCKDENGNDPVDFYTAKITEDMTVYACYSEGRLVTLKTGAGYILTAQVGSVSPVKLGGSFTFKFALAEGYEKTDSFAVKVNGVTVGLTEEGNGIYIYTITNIVEDKTVTVEGVKKKAGGGKPDSGTKPGGDGGTKPTDGTPSTDNTPTVDEKKPDDTEKEKPGDDKKPGNTDDRKPGGADEKKPGDGTPPTDGIPPIDEDTPVVPVIIGDGRVIISDKTPGGASGQADGASAGKPIYTGTADGQTTAGTVLQMYDESGNPAGTVIVTVVCEEQAYTAGVVNTVAVANAVLTPEQIQLVNNGETIEVRIDVKDISETVSGQDKEVVESGLTEYQKEIPELTLGMYVDISMFIRIGEGDWDAVTSTEEPVEVIIGIPEELMEDGREFYIIRSHEGEYTILNDMDSDPDTITISTDLFSAYAIAYRQTDTDHAQGGNAKCGLCHICPTFLGICYFIWLAVIIAAILVIVLIVWRKKKDDDRKQAAEK